MIGSSALCDISNAVSQGADQPTAVHKAIHQSISQQEGQVCQSESDSHVKVLQVLDELQKQLPEEAIRHITTAKVIYKPTDAGISNIRM